MKSRLFCIILAMSLAISMTYALNITVAPSSGTPGSDPTDTIEDAIAQINAGPDLSNTITLRSTEGAIVLPDNTDWTFTGFKSCDFVAESGQPVVVLNGAPGIRYMVTIDGATTATLTFTDIGFVPETGLTYANNVGDGFAAYSCHYVFTNCVFSANDGSNGIASQEGDAAYTGTNCVGDDWIQPQSGCGDVTFHNCTLTGCNDDAIIIGGHDTGHTLLLDQGTCIANIGGAGIQVYYQNANVTLDGTAGRVQIANVGKRPATTDTGIKFFWDVGCSLNITRSDIISCSNAAIYDFEGITPINITDTRIAFANYGSATPAALFAVDDISNDSAYPQAINLTRVTFHDCQGTPPEHKTFYYADGANDPQPTYTIIDSIFSGAGDDFDMLNAGAVAVNKTFTAVVQAGPHAVGAVGDMGAGSVSADPQYDTLYYIVGRAQENPFFLLPTDSAYDTAGSTGGKLYGGATPRTSVNHWELY